jgi:ParB-like nuclease family protein
MPVGYKTGGRQAGIRNKPKAVVMPVATSVSALVEAAGAGAAPAGGVSPVRAGAREAKSDGLPPSRHVRVDQLIPFEGNARTHSRESIDKLCNLITAFGWTSPILVAGRKILAGHARRLAALKLGIEIVPVIDLKHLTRAQQEAVILSDNRAALDGGWDVGLLSEAFDRLKEMDVDLALTAFDADDLTRLFDAPEQEPPPVRRTEKTVECPKCHHAFSP